jgi:hypothetical protein
VEEHFKMKHVTPGETVVGIVREVEEHFKMKDVTPEQVKSILTEMVEEHFKNLIKCVK